MNSQFEGVSAALMDLIKAEISLGSDFIKSVTGLDVPSLGDTLRSGRDRMTKSCCRIPPPCWMPQPLGDCISHVGQCRTACVRLVIANCDRVARTVTVEAVDKSGKVTVTPASLTLGPMERGSISVCLPVPQHAADGTRYETLIWVRGCKEHFLRWTVSVGTVGFDSCHEIAVDDCPDLLHHWYDHFYCARPCRTDGRIPPAGTHG